MVAADVRRRRSVRFSGEVRLLTRLCENSSPAGDPGKTTSTVSIWRVFFGGEGSENPFFVLPRRHFGVFAQPVTSAATITGSSAISKIGVFIPWPMISVVLQ